MKKHEGPTPYMQSYVVVMRSGRLVCWRSKAIDAEEGRRLASEYAKQKAGEDVWDIANRPITMSGSHYKNGVTS